jgi:hypothetical protein
MFVVMFGFLAPKHLHSLAFLSFEFEPDEDYSRNYY